jgi:hypothetical protein
MQVMNTSEVDVRGAFIGTDLFLGFSTSLWRPHANSLTDAQST